MLIISTNCTYCSVNAMANGVFRKEKGCFRRKHPS
jgi:hypothetical protein